MKLEKFGGSSAARSVLNVGKAESVDVTSPAERTIRQLGIAVAIVLFEAHEASKKPRSNVE